MKVDNSLLDHAPSIQMRSFHDVVEIRISHSHRELRQALFEMRKALDDIIANHLDPAEEVEVPQMSTIPTYLHN